MVVRLFFQSLRNLALGWLRLLIWTIVESLSELRESLLKSLTLRFLNVMIGLDSMLMLSRSGNVAFSPHKVTSIE